jgi:hypothetical protein
VVLDFESLHHPGVDLIMHGAVRQPGSTRSTGCHPGVTQVRVD